MTAIESSSIIEASVPVIDTPAKKEFKFNPYCKDFEGSNPNNAEIFSLENFLYDGGFEAVMYYNQFYPGMEIEGMNWGYPGGFYDGSTYYDTSASSYYSNSPSNQNSETKAEFRFSPEAPEFVVPSSVESVSREMMLLLRPEPEVCVPSKEEMPCKCFDKSVILKSSKVEKKSYEKKSSRSERKR